MKPFRRTPPVPTTTSDSPCQHHEPTAAPRHHTRRALRIISYGILNGAATTAGRALMDAVLWLIQHH
ncbi:hypothetical protein [Micromonospora matsumotoense]|uniref:hypothetical protein n=1 Tax=Micromonospora matsumotoense TaxID=121616 RepID=UPI000B865F0B|nr:hypothetical protein [Micromonospora matsumotoense]